MTKYIYLIFILCGLTSCKTISVNKEYQTRTTQNIQLGSIGEEKNFVLEKDYNNTAIPKYLEPIKVHIYPVAFNKKTFNAYQDAMVFQSKDLGVNFIDSIETKPTYLKIEIADRLSILKSLNSHENKDIFDFLKNKSESHIVTTISIAFKKDIIDAINNADEVFLVNSGINSYVLKTFKSKTEQETILFNEGVVFGYQSSNTCWKENEKYQLEIVDLVESDDECPNKTYRSSKRAKKKINYYKF